MQIIICSEDRAVQLSHTAKIPTVIISITCPDDEPVRFADNSNILGIFRMRFNDIDHDRIPNIPPPNQSDFNGLKEFVDSIRNGEAEELIVHCGAGISRSAATAAAVAEYLGGEYLKVKEDVFCGDGRYHPNSLVLKYACRELGVGELKTEEYYNDIFGKDTESGDAE